MVLNARDSLSFDRSSSSNGGLLCPVMPGAYAGRWCPAARMVYRLSTDALWRSSSLMFWMKLLGSRHADFGCLNCCSDDPVPICSDACDGLLTAAFCRLLTRGRNRRPQSARSIPMRQARPHCLQAMSLPVPALLSTTSQRRQQSQLYRPATTAAPASGRHHRDDMPGGRPGAGTV